MNLNQHRCTFITARPSDLRQKLGISFKPKEAKSQIALSQADRDDPILVPKMEDNHERLRGLLLTQVDPLTQRVHESSLLGRLLFKPPQQSQQRVLRLNVEHLDSNPSQDSNASAESLEDASVLNWEVAPQNEEKLQVYFVKDEKSVVTEVQLRPIETLLEHYG